MMSQYSRVSKIYSENPLRLPDSDTWTQFGEQIAICPLSWNKSHPT